MLKKKLVKMWKRDHPNESNLWMLPKTPGIRPTKYYHIKALGDVYVAYGQKAERWKAECAWNDLICDCVMLYEGVTVFFEVDRGNEEMKILEEKIRKYIHYSDDPVIFVLEDGIRRTAIKTGDNIARFVSSYVKDPRKARQVSWTMIDMLKADPFGQRLYNPTDKLTLDELCSIYRAS